MDDSGSGSGMDESTSPLSTASETPATLGTNSNALNTVSMELAPAHIRALVSEAGGLVPTDHPNIFCTPLPHHCRVNSPIHVPFLVVSNMSLPDETVVRLSAGNKFNPVADMKNCESLMGDNVAKFPDLRFVGRSGRGRRLNVKIDFLTNSGFSAVYENAIKVTADGPREPRRHKQHPYAMERLPKSPIEFKADWTLNGLLPIESPDCTSQRSPHSVDSGTEEDVPMNTDTNLMLTTIPSHYGNGRKETKPQFIGNSVMGENNFKRTANVDTTGGQGISSGPDSPNHNVHKAPVSHLLPHRVLILPTSPTVISPPGSATLPNQPNPYSVNGGKLTQMASGKTSGNENHSLQFIPVSGGKGGMQLQQIIMPSTPPPSSHGTTTQNYLNFIPISPKLVQSSPLLQPITSWNSILASPRLTTSPESGLDMMQNISFLKGLDHKCILKLLSLMDLNKYHPMFIQEHVDGELLSSMSDLDLEELGVKSSLHKKRFLKLIEGKHSAKDYLEKGNPYLDEV